MKLNSQLKQPVLSEKTHDQMEKGIYTFLVDRKSRKENIAKQVESQFSVKVKKVNITASAHKTKRVGLTRKTTQTSRGKKAIVWLAPGYKIEILSPKSAKGKTKKGSREKDVQTASAERKEA